MRAASARWWSSAGIGEHFALAMRSRCRSFDSARPEATPLPSRLGLPWLPTTSSLLLSTALRAALCCSGSPYFLLPASTYPFRPVYHPRQRAQARTVLPDVAERTALFNGVLTAPCSVPHPSENLIQLRIQMYGAFSAVLCSASTVFSSAPSRRPCLSAIFNACTLALLSPIASACTIVWFGPSYAPDPGFRTASHPTLLSQRPHALSATYHHPTKFDYGPMTTVNPLMSPMPSNRLFELRKSQRPPLLSRHPPGRARRSRLAL
jgi:hypothetical protein